MTQRAVRIVPRFTVSPSDYVPVNRHITRVQAIGKNGGEAGMHLSGPPRRARGAGYVVESMGRVSSLIYWTPPRQTGGGIMTELQPS